jgi:outer membrane protein assembly factor BamB
MRCLAAVLFLLVTVSVARAEDWPVFGHDSARTAVAVNRTLRPANVPPLQIRWHITLGNVADSAPIVVGNRIFLTRRDGATLAIDTASGSILWTFATAGPNITTSVPAYDESTQTLYAPGVDGAVHKLDPATGVELTGNGFPATITLAPTTEEDASPLNVANGYLYAQTSGYNGDGTPYVGHIAAIRLTDGNTIVFNTLCSASRVLIQPQTCAAQRSGLWSRAGIVVDPDPTMGGRIYAASGNGPYDPTAGSYGDTIFSLTVDASQLIGTATPRNYQQLSRDDLDLGSSSPALLPRQNGSATPLLAVQGGKNSELRLFDRTNLSGLGPPLQTLKLGYELFAAPAVWTDPRGTTFVFITLPDGVHAFRLGTQNSRSRLTPAWSTSIHFGNAGTSPIVAGGVLYVAVSGQLDALDPRSGALIGSAALGAIHWQSPVAANGVIYCADQTGALTAFGR